MPAAPRAACVIGYPARHSRSPKLHGYWIARYGLEAVYRAEEVPPQDAARFITHLSDHGYVGANVTMPHKDLAFELSEPDARATAVGAANTLWLEDGVLKSTNTDVEGFIGALDAAAPGWAQKWDQRWDQESDRDNSRATGEAVISADTNGATVSEAVVLGAGGAARAVVVGLIERGITRIHVVNRTRAKAEALAERYGSRITPAAWSDLATLLPRAGLLANATALGMHGHPPLDVDVGLLPAGAVVSDIVYVPLTTPLLTAAQARGLTTSNGLNMLLHQAVGGFERWFGIRPEVTQELYDLLAADIAANEARG